MNKQLEKVNIIPEADGPISHLPVPVSESSALLSMIERAARDPSIDIERLERLLVRADTVRAQVAEASFNEAMAQVQASIPRVAPDKRNKSTNSDYASFAAFDRAVRKLYTDAGFALSFNEEDSPKPDHVRTVCYVTHVVKGAQLSHTRKYHADLPADGKGAKGGDVMTKTHATGAAFTYGQRYVLKMIFNIAVGVDDDGNAASATGAVTITQEQADQLVDLIEANGKDRTKFLKWARVERIEDIGADYFQSCVDAIKAKK